MASLVSVFSIFMAALIKHQYKRASREELQAYWGAAVSGFFAAIQMMKSSSGECHAECAE